MALSWKTSLRCVGRMTITRLKLVLSLYIKIMLSSHQLVALAAFGEQKPNVVLIGSSFVGMETASILAKQANITVIGMEKVSSFI